MNHAEITNYVELHSRIMKLNYLKEEQEILIKKNLKEVAYSLHPSVMLESMVSNFFEGKKGMSDLKSLGLSLGRDFLITKLIGKGGSLKSFLSSLAVKKVVDYVVNNHSDLLIKGIHKLENYFSGPKVKSNDGY
jgi:hypothetical protein